MAKLLVVATPIGNLNDLTPRMKEALAACDLIAAEDTRVTMKLLNHLEIKKPLVACHRHNEPRVAAEIVSRMVREDLTVALTCDAGTPGISDPGVELVRLAREAGVPVTPVCGPSALAAALSASGFDAREFLFCGFLPREKKPLREKLEAIRRGGAQVFVAYESPHRVVALVREIAALWPRCRLCVFCDISKLHERCDAGAPEEVLQSLSANENAEKGEYALAVDLSPLGPLPPEAPALTAEQIMLPMLLDGADIETAAQAALKSCPRNEVYRARLRIRRFLEERDTEK